MKKISCSFCSFGTLMFFNYCAFAYYVVVPLGFNFLIAFGSAVVTVLPSISKYVDFFTKLLFGFGIAFNYQLLHFTW